MVQAVRVPGKGWYVFAGLVAVAGVAAIAALIARFVLTLDRGEHFLVPGRHTVEFDRTGKYLLWNDYRTVFRGRTFEAPEQLPPGVRVAVHDKAGGPSPAISAGSGKATIGNTSSVAVFQFEIARPGRYEIVVEGDFPQQIFSVSRDFVAGLLWTIFGAFALIFGGFGAATAIAAWAFIRREEARRVVAPGGAAMRPERERSLEQITAIIYGLQVASFLVGITLVAAVIVNYVKRKDVEGTWLESHFRWQIRTFWFSLLWLGVGLATMVIVIGVFVLMVSAVWLLYRAIRGWVALEDRKPMYT